MCLWIFSQASAEGGAIWGLGYMKWREMCGWGKTRVFIFPPFYSLRSMQQLLLYFKEMVKIPRGYRLMLFLNVYTNINTQNKYRSKWNTPTSTITKSLSHGEISSYPHLLELGLCHKPLWLIFLNYFVSYEMQLWIFHILIANPSFSFVKLPMFLAYFCVVEMNSQG